MSCDSKAAPARRAASFLTAAAAMLCGLIACSAGSGPGAGAAAPAALATPAAAAAEHAAVADDTGARIYNGNCIPCHQQNGNGIPNVFPSLAGSKVVTGDPEVLALWVMKGVRPAILPAGRYPTAMQQFAWLKDKDAAALFTYLRSSFGNAAAPVDAATVAQALGR
jgi:mono/diheme cytochrome c family protein